MATRAAKPIKTDTISLAEAAYMLQAELGSLRQWVAFLNDINRGESTNLYGLQLMAAARQHDGHVWRPRYALSNVQEFVRFVQAIDSNARPARIDPVPLMIHKGRYWKLNKFDKEGNPVTKATRPAPAMSCTTRHTGSAATMH